MPVKGLGNHDRPNSRLALDRLGSRYSEFADASLSTTNCDDRVNDLDEGEDDDERNDNTIHGTYLFLGEDEGLGKNLAKPR